MRAAPLLVPLIAFASSLTDAAPKDKPREDKPREDKPQDRFEEGMLTRFHMHENYGIVRAIERLLLRGRLDDAKPLAAAIGEAPDEAGMATYATQSAEVRSRAVDLSRAKSLDEAIRLEARLVLACAGCHTDSGVVPDLAKAPPLPPDRDTVEARMARHMWAADRLWVGIVADSPDAWANGLDLLASGSRTWPKLTAAQTPFAQRMQRTAQSARRAKGTTLATRSATYGELLSTCAGCHTTPP